MASLTAMGGVPRGIIAMWAGALVELPSGWTLCNGTNGTPDLRNRFIVGSHGKYGTGDKGGADSVALNVGEMPSHDHAASSNNAGHHGHSGSTSTNGNHRHSIDNASIEGNPGNPGAVGSDLLIGADIPTFWAGNHSHSLQINGNGAHSHAINIGWRGGNKAHENRPPYYALAYIMKI